MGVKIQKSPTEDLFCSICKGSCWQEDNAATQAVAKEKFGIIPNNCVNEQDGMSRCPYK